MSNPATLPEQPVTDSKEGVYHSAADAAHVEKVSAHENEYEYMVARLNTLDPPVTPEEEKRVKRKIDLRLPPFLLVLYIFTWLDRGALGG